MTLMGIFILLDKFVLSRIQKFSDWAQLTFGINNFWFARVSIALFTSALLLRKCVDFYINTSVTSRIASVLLVALMMFVGYLCNRDVNQAEEDCLSAPETRNVKELTFRTMRIMCLVLVLLQLVHFIPQMMMLPPADVEYWLWSLIKISDTFFMFDITGYTLYHYFVSCTPNPYQKSKLKKLMERIEKMFTAEPALAKSE